MNFRRLAVAITLVVSFFVPGRDSGMCRAQEITVAAAADLQSVMQDVATRFQKETGKETTQWRAIRHVLLDESRLPQET
jgi:ABC-type molybdate transport system substrate-binding protein